MQVYTLWMQQKPVGDIIEPTIICHKKCISVAEMLIKVYFKTYADYTWILDTHK